MRFPACLSCFSGKRPGATADAGPASGGHARSADLTRVARGQQRRHQPSGLAPRGARAAGTAGKEGPCPADTAEGGKAQNESNGGPQGTCLHSRPWNL